MTHASSHQNNVSVRIYYKDIGIATKPVLTMKHDIQIAAKQYKLATLTVIGITMNDNHSSCDERYHIEKPKRKGVFQREIAEKVRRLHATISRKLRCNSSGSSAILFSRQACINNKGAGLGGA